MQQTSLQSYIELRDRHLGEMQRKVYNVFRKYYKLTDRDILNYLELTDMNKVRPRRRELENMGYIKKIGVSIDKYTKKRVNVYSAWV